MSAELSWVQCLWGGITAASGPGAVLAACSVGVAALGFGARHRRLHLALGGLLMVGVFAAALTRRGVGLDGGLVETLVAAGCVVVLAGTWLRDDGGSVWGALLGGLVLGIWATLLRQDLHGPVLTALRGPWQTPPAWGSLFVFHLGTAIGLAAVGAIAQEIGRRLGSRVALAVATVMALVLVVATLTGGIDALQQQLTLRWPAWRVG